MKSKDFLSFLSHQELPPVALKKATQKDISLSFSKRTIIFKFLSFQLLGALFSLTVCPQFGLGFVEGHGIAHIFRMIGDWACAAFCGSLFLSSGVMVAFMGMKGEELWWVWRRYKYTLILLPALMWAGLMLTNMNVRIHTETASYHGIWIMMGIVVQGLWLHLRSQNYSKLLAS